MIYGSFEGTPMIYDENVRVPNFSQSADFITEWVI